MNSIRRQSPRRGLRTVQDWIACGVVFIALFSTTAAQAEGCKLSGSVSLPLSVPLYGEAQGGQPVARFTGAQVPLTVSDFPKDASGRAKVHTGTGQGNLSIEAFVDVKALKFSTTRRLPLIQNHVWIGKHAEVQVVGVGADKLQVLRQEKYPINQQFRAWTACDGLALGYRALPGWDKPGNARGFLVEKPEVELFDTYGRDRHAIWNLKRADFGTGILLWSDQRRNGYAHVHFHGSVVLDAWVKGSDLKWLPVGETTDQFVPAAPKHTSQLTVRDNPKVVKVDKAVPVRLAPKSDGPQVGVAEPGTELYVTDIVAGFASVLPKAMNLAPVDGGQFWVDAKELGL